MGRESGMTQLFTVIVRTGLVAAVMVATVPMSASAQTTESAIEGEPAAVGVEEAKASPTSEEDSLESQSLRNELHREILDYREAYIDRWLTVIAIVLTAFGLVVPVVGLIGFRRFQAIETEAKNSVETVTELVAEAERYVEEIKGKREEAKEIIRNMSSEIAAKDPQKANQAIADVRENPEASPIDKAIAYAISLQQQRRVDDAIEKWRAIAQVVEGSDNDLAARAWLSVGYLLQDRDPEKSISVYDLAILLNPDYAKAYNNRGAAKRALGRNDEAIADYDQALCLNPNLANAYTNRGNAKGALGQHNEAIADHDQALRLNPDFAEAYSNRGVAKAALGRHNEAIADYNKALCLKPDLANAYTNRGNAKGALGQHNEAIADHDQALRLNPDLAEAYSNRGVAKAALGRYEDAIADYDKALRLNSNDVKAYTNRGNAKDALGQHNNAIADHDKALCLKPDFADAYTNRGNAKAALGQYEDAIADYDKALRLNSNDVKAYTNRGNAKDALGQHNDAIADYDQAVRLEPNYSEAYINRGTTKVVLGLQGEARKDLETALELARNAGDEDLVTTVEQLLRNLDDDESP